MAKTPEEKREYAKKWRLENKEKNRECQKRWYEANKERKNEQANAWRKANPEKYAAITKRYRDSHVDELRERDRQRYHKDPEKEKARNKRYFEQNPDYHRKWKEANPERAADSYYKYMFSLAPGEYAAMLQRQNGKCAICGATPGKKALCVDHDHATNSVRGLLCDSCNVGLGRFGDSEEVLRAVLNYLISYKKNEQVG